MFKKICKMFKRKYYYHVSYQFNGMKDNQKINGIGDMTFIANGKIKNFGDISKIKKLISEDLSEEGCENACVALFNIMRLKNNK